MKSLALIHDIFRGIEPVERRNLVAVISSVKVVLENSQILKADALPSWESASLNKIAFIDAVIQLKNLTGLAIYNDQSVINNLKKLEDYNFEKIMDIVDSVVDSEDIEGYCRELRGTASVAGKLYNNTTPDSVNDIPVRIIEPRVSDIIGDYFNGESGTEIGVIKYFKHNGENIDKLNYYGAEKEETSFAMGQLVNFLITGDKEGIVLGDSIRKDVFRGRRFDVCISSPPFMLRKDLNPRIFSEGNRFKYGSKYFSTINMEWVIVDLILSSLNERGKAAVLLPMGSMFRTGVEEKIRQYIIRNDVIEAVVKIPQGIFPNTSIDTCWLIFNRCKEKKRRGTVQFIDVSAYTENVDRRNKTISEEGVEMAVESYKAFEENDISLILDINEISENNYRLDAFDYVKSEQLKRNIRDIKMVELWNVAQIRRGVQINKGRLDTLNTGSERTHYLISIGNIIDGKIEVDEADKIRIESKWQGVYDVHKGDILITSKGSKFKAAIVEEEMNAIVSANLFIIRCYKNKYIPEVLKYYLESELGQRLLEGVIKGTVVKSIATRDLERFSVPDINIERQMDIVRRIRNAEEEYEKKLKEAEIIYKNRKCEINHQLNII